MPQWKRPPGRRSSVAFSMVKPLGPHQRARPSGSVQALHTRLRGASKTRVMTSAGSPAGGALLSFFPSMPLLLGLQLFQVIAQPVEVLFPKPAIVAKPVVDIAKGRRGKPARPPLRLAAALDEAGALQHFQMLRNRRKAHVEGRTELGDRGFARGEAGEEDRK